VHDIEVWVERLQRPALAECQTDEQRTVVIRAYGDLARMHIDAVSQGHGMPPMLHRRRA
jgi:hypothetical protein